MGNLTGKRIDLTFDGLIKTNDEQPIDGTLKTLQDGVGNNLPIQVSTTTVNFTGIVTGDNNTTYSLDTLQAVDQIEINLNGINPSSQSTLVITAGTNITLTDDGNAGFTIDASVPTGGVTTLNTLDGALSLIAGGNITITDNGVDQITINAIDTNTTYDLTAAQTGANVEIQLDPSVGTTDVVTLVAGTNITLTEAGGNVTIDAAGGGGDEFTSIYQNNVMNDSMGGYPPTVFGRFSQPINARPGIGAAIDQDNSKTMFVPLYLQAGEVIENLTVPFPQIGVACDLVFELYAGGPITNQPYSRIYTETFPVTDTNDHWYNFTLSAPQPIVTGTKYWVGLRTTNDRKLGQINGDAGIQTFFHWGGWGTSVVGISPINTYYYNAAPATAPPAIITEPYPWGAREEITILMIR